MSLVTRCLSGLLLVSLSVWYGKIVMVAALNLASDAVDSDERNCTVWNVTIVNQLELISFLRNVTIYTDQWNTTNCIYLSLAGGRKSSYELDIVKLMKISRNGSLTMRRSGALLAEFNCKTGLSDLEELNKTVKPLSSASLVLLDGLAFSGCPVPILIEEASNVVIQNCVFQ